MNLFEGKVAGLEGDQVLVEVRGLGRIAVPGHAGLTGSIGIAVRPEKLRLDSGAPADGRIGYRGTVSDVAYHGETSWVFVGDESGHSVLVALQNEARSTTPRVTVGEEIWVSWAPGDTLVLED